MTNFTNGAATQPNGHGPHLPLPAVSAALGENASALVRPPVAPRYDPPMISRRTPTLSDSSVGREIRALRRGQGRTQKELARAIGVTGAQLHRYEAGTTRIAASRLIAIADALGVGADSLIAAGYNQPGSVTIPVAAPYSIQSSDDIVELIELFGTITDIRHRSALVAVARMMALPNGRESTIAEG